MAIKIERECLCMLNGQLTSEEIAMLLRNNNIKCIILSGIENSEMLSYESWKRINDIIFLTRKDISLSIDNFYFKECDLSFLAIMTNVEKLSIGGGRYPSGFDNVTKLKQLKSLNIVLPDLPSYEFLDDLSPDIEELHIKSSSLKQIELGFVGQLSKLKTLVIEGIKYNNLDFILKLHNLKELSLNSITITDFNFGINLKQLWALKIVNCGVKNISSLTKINHIKYLSLYRLKGITNLDFILDFQGLQNLEIEGMGKIEKLPDLSNLKELRRVVLIGLKGLSDFTGLANCKYIEEIYVANMNKLRSDTFQFLTHYSNLKIANIVFTNDKDTERYKEMMKGNCIDITSSYFNNKFVYK